MVANASKKDSAPGRPQPAGDKANAPQEGLVTDQLRDQHLLEIELTERIAERLSHWAKLFGFFVGIPVTLIGLLVAAPGIVLGTLGVKDYRDFMKEIEAAKRQAIDSLKTEAEVERASIKAVDQKIQGIYGDANELKAELQQARKVGQEVRELSGRVNTIQQRLEILGGGGVDGRQLSELQERFLAYQKYLSGIGFNVHESAVRLEITTQPLGGGSPAYYDPKERTMRIGASIIDDVDIIYREYTHHVLSLGGWPVSTAGVSHWDADDVESALAYYFPCSFQTKSKFGTASAKRLVDKDYILDLNNRNKLERRLQKSDGSGESAWREVQAWGGRLVEDENGMWR